ncbi:hypothetical protein [Siphonobacter curvatus]|uniref:Uncharacterized protein n=1 Tax=Siphonobacter curvatus TaxID=2094562 RepID=A0A2S7IQJ0_9BACT|nr:hypothetical protein [Siphonobacter curvatus]PQA59971.1 hypothetical protein C5O19_10205 [Siphonobacter curvatus]
MNVTTQSSWRSLYRLTVARFFLGLFTVMLVNGVVFRHGHRLADGRIISHAHPFRSKTKGPIQPNSHTSLELLLLDAVSNPVLDLPSVESIDFQTWEIELSPVFTLFYQGITPIGEFLYYSLRGPPAA